MEKVIGDAAEPWKAGNPGGTVVTVDMHSLDRVNMARNRQRSCNIGPGVIGACPRFGLAPTGPAGFFPVTQGVVLGSHDEGLWPSEHGFSYTNDR